MSRRVHRQVRTPADCEHCAVQTKSIDRSRRCFGYGPHRGRLAVGRCQNFIDQGSGHGPSAVFVRQRDRFTDAAEGSVPARNRAKSRALAGRSDSPRLQLPLVGRGVRVDGVPHRGGGCQILRGVVAETSVSSRPSRGPSHTIYWRRAKWSSLVLSRRSSPPVTRHRVLRQPQLRHSRSRRTSRTSCLKRRWNRTPD